MRAFAVFSALFLAASGVLATPSLTPGALVARQATAIPKVPAECAASCVALEKLSACDVNLDCMCTNEIGQGLASCGVCGIKYMANSTDINTYKVQFQSSINTYADSCTEAGHKVGPFDVLGASSGTGTGASPASNNPNSAASVRSGCALAGLTAVVMALVL
ncbi:hypothetical protein FRC09_015091 [Ceratobasidium sp. 395]|nr:hypothetical protein FRC09_015091 [Ceratobasidium sp. 395]